MPTSSSNLATLSSTATVASTTADLEPNKTQLMTKPGVITTTITLLHNSQPATSYTPSNSKTITNGQPKMSFSSSSTATIKMSVNIIQSQTKQLDLSATTILGLTAITHSPTPKLSATPLTPAKAGYSNTHKVLFAMSGVAAVISITVVCLTIFYFVYTRNKQKR